MEYDNVFEHFAKKNNFIVLKTLGKGGFGVIKEIAIKGKIFAAKLTQKKDINDFDQSEIIRDLRGPGIVKIIKDDQMKIGNLIYELVIMEKANLKDLSKFIYFIYNKNLLNLIFKTPFEMIGDNLSRYFVKQILNGIKLLDMNNYIHFDIKPPNFLIFLEMVVKLIDFDLLRKTKIDANNNMKIPGGTKGYLSPEYYQYEGLVDEKTAKKQDFFALGATIFFLKYGREMLEYTPFKEGLITSDVLIELIEKSLDQIKTGTFSDKEFIDFLSSLIQYKPEQRPDFETIYRNKWVNKYSDEIEEIVEINKSNEEKLIIELNKSDFLIGKKKIDNNNISNKKLKNNINRHKFIFIKKK